MDHTLAEDVRRVILGLFSTIPGYITDYRPVIYRQGDDKLPSKIKASGEMRLLRKTRGPALRRCLSESKNHNETTPVARFMQGLVLGA